MEDRDKVAGLSARMNMEQRTKFTLGQALCDFMAAELAGCEDDDAQAETHALG